MSLVRPPRDEWTRLNELEERIAKLERGNPFQGSAASVVDQNGVVRLIMGKLGDGDWGVAVFDASGVEQARLGQLNASPEIYGLGVLPYGGTHLQQVCGILSEMQSATYNTTSTSWVSPTGAPSIQAEIGPSGKADCTIGAHIATGDVSQQGYVGLFVDNAGPYYDVGTSESVGAGGISADVFGRFTMTGLTAGVHTFDLRVSTANNATHNVGFSNVSLTLSPL